MRKLITATLATLFCLTLATAPASAKPEVSYTPWYSTIDCGRGPVDVVSAMEDEWSDLEALDSRAKYVPVEWHLDLGGRMYDAYRPGKAPKHTVTCAYRDDFASGTVVLKRTGHLNRDRDDRGHGDDDDRDHDRDDD